MSLKSKNWDDKLLKDVYHIERYNTKGGVTIKYSFINVNFIDGWISERFEVGEKIIERAVIVYEVTQFFNYKEMDWDALIKSEDEPVLLSEDKKSCLFSETPKKKTVLLDEEPSKGNVWLRNNDGKIELYKSNYDTSD